jgi:A/G-specific adenine glycosylase
MGKTHAVAARKDVGKNIAVEEAVTFATSRGSSNVSAAALPPLRPTLSGHSAQPRKSGTPDLCRGRDKDEGDVARAHCAPNPVALLAWYDRHRRKLPWRADAGQRPDPYCVWLSEIMLQQTTAKAVAPYYVRFLARWPNVRALAAAKLIDVLKLWAGLGYYARARNLHACAKAVSERHGGHLPADERALRALPGIGAYTAAAIAAIAFDARATPVDGNIERVIARLHAVEGELAGAKPTIRRLAEALTPTERTGDFAQALMDLGATVCTPKKPACVLCPWTDVCTARRRGDAETFPRKAPKVAGKLRRGAAFVIVRNGHVLVRTRPAKGLLGGMTEVPTGVWTDELAPRGALDDAPVLGRASLTWRRVPGVVRHVFTHFPLELTVHTATVAGHAVLPPGARWVPRTDLANEALPNVMRKVLAHAGLL